MKDSASRNFVVFIPGTRWEDTQGTDHRLAEAMAKELSILWVDPPMPVIGPASVVRPRTLRRFYLDQPLPGLYRLRFLAPPKFTHVLMEPVVQTLRLMAVRTAMSRLQGTVVGSVLLSPRDAFLTGVPGFKALHITDDWTAGAALMGLNAERVLARLKENMRRADVLSAVSPPLADCMSHVAGGREVVVLPNGCTIAPELPPAVGEARAVLLGQLNERLDVELLDQLADTGVDIEIIGPRRERESAFTLKLDNFIARPNVTWRGEVAPQQVPGLLAGASVGLTPYADTEFNRASFPLKTLDYLATGLPVVATDSAAVQWLAVSGIYIAHSRSEFLNLVNKHGATPPTSEQRLYLREQARRHTWDARSQQLLNLAGWLS